MADPVSLAAISMGANILGGVTSAVGGIMKGSADSSMYKYQAGVARINADIQRKNAENARYMGEREAQRQGMKARFQIGQTRVEQSGRGLVVGEGSAGRVTESQEMLSKHDQSTIRATAARRAYGHEVEAASQESQANMYGKAAQRSKTASYIGAVGSILGTASSVSSKWLDASRLGIFGGQADTRTSDDYWYA